MSSSEDHPESGSPRLTISCPGCDAELTIDLTTGAVVWHRPTPPSPPASLDDMVKQLATKRQEVADRFERERRALDDRSRVLDAKVKESLKRVDPDAPPPLRPIDLD